jgi:short-subunit dehydrogenase
LSSGPFLCLEISASNQNQPERRKVMTAAPDTNSPRRPVALITGASSGIGADLARRYACAGYDLIICARRQSLLEDLAAELSDVRVHVAVADLAKSRGPAKLVSAVEASGWEVDLLVNNAGIAPSGWFNSNSKKNITDAINLNVRALTELCHYFGEQMVRRGSGRIMNVASIVSFQAVPGMAVYSATKAYVLSLSESLAEEWRDTGVSVTALCPGLTRTDLAKGFSDQELPEFVMADSKTVADEGYRAAKAGRTVHVSGWLNQAVVEWLQLQPRWWTRTLSGVAARSGFIPGATRQSASSR